MADSLLEQLDATRDGYEDECAWHRFLIDAYTGGGGFQGSVKQPTSGFWGPAADRYSSSPSSAGRLGNVPSSYLDRYPREDDEKYKARIAISHYPNYVEPLTDLKLSYIGKRPATVSNRPGEIDDWRRDMDGRGSAFDRTAALCILRAAVLGWCPLLVDMLEQPEGVTTRAQARALGVDQPRAIALLPANLTDWDTDDAGEFRWAKVRTDHVERLDPFAAPVEVSVVTIWFPGHFDRYEIRKDGAKRGATQTHAGVPHGFGRVPVTILRHKEDPGCSVRGLPMHGAVAKESKALFNRISELEEHLRSQVFPVLVLAMRNPEGAGQVTLGTDNGLQIDPQQSNKHYYLAPPASVAATLETRAEASIREMYRMARVEYGRQSGGQVASGTSRKFEFAQTNQALADYAAQIARWERDVDDLVAAPLNVDTSGETVQAQTEFGAEDLEADIRNVMDTISMSVGPTATKMLKLRVIEQQAPSLSPEDRAAIVADLDAAELEAKQAAALGREIAETETDEPDEAREKDEHEEEPAEEAA